MPAAWRAGRGVAVLCLGLLATLGARAQSTTSQPTAPAVPTPAELAAPQSPDAAAPDTVALRQYLQQADRLQRQHKESAALAEYQKILKTNTQHYEGLWQAAVLSVRIGNRYTDESRKAAYFGEARRYAERALTLRPEGGESNYALALALFSQAGLLTARDRLQLYQQLQLPVQLAVARRPDLPEAWQLLGRWHYRVAHYNLLERAYSKVLLGGVPRGASVAQAIESLEKARALAPGRIQYYYDLARVYKYQHQRSQALALLREAVRLPTYTSEDLSMNRLCQQLLAPLERAAARRNRRHARWYQRLRPQPKAAKQL